MKNQTPTLAGALAPPAVFGHVSEKQFFALPSLLLIPIVLLACMSPARADTFENFVIQNSSNPSVPGGTLFGGGTYSGSFSLDESLIPSNPDARFALQSFDVRFTEPFFNIDRDISSANGSSAIFSSVPLNDTQQTGTDLAIDFIDFEGPDLTDLTLELIEPAGVFQGGLVAFAAADDFLIRNFSFDDTGSALVIDPAVVPLSTAVPEPSTWTTLLIGVAGLGYAGYRKSRPGKSPSPENLAPPSLLQAR